MIVVCNGDRYLYVCRMAIYGLIIGDSLFALSGYEHRGQEEVVLAPTY
jgi:hypothetical protein